MFQDNVSGSQSPHVKHVSSSCKVIPALSISYLWPEFFPAGCMHSPPQKCVLGCGWLVYTHAVTSMSVYVLPLPASASARSVPDVAPAVAIDLTDSSQSLCHFLTSQLTLVSAYTTSLSALAESSPKLRAEGERWPFCSWLSDVAKTDVPTRKASIFDLDPMAAGAFHQARAALSNV